MDTDRICFSWNVFVVFLLMGTSTFVCEEKCRLEDGSNKLSTCEYGCCPDIDHGGCCPCTVNSTTLQCPTTTTYVNTTEPATPNTTTTTTTTTTTGLLTVRTTFKPKPEAPTLSTLDIILIVFVCALTLAVVGLSVVLWRKRHNKINSIDGDRDPLHTGGLTIESMTPPASTEKPAAV